MYRLEEIFVVSDAELAVVIIRALGYPELNWGQHINFLNDKGISISGNQLSRADAFEAIWLAVSSPVAKDNKILGVELGKLDANLFEPQVKNLAINSVSANNLKEIIVAFNQPVNKDELGKFSLDNKVKIAEKSLSEDATVITLTTVTPLKEKMEYTLTVEDTKAVAEKAEKLPKTEMKFSVVDTDRPEVVSVEFTGPKHMTITFSEPMDSQKGKVMIKGEKISLSVGEVKVDGKKASVKLLSTPQDGKEYTVRVEDFKDAAKLQNKISETKVTFVKDTETPTAEIAEISQEEMLVKFSKPMRGATLNNPALYHHSFTKYTANALYVLDSKGKAVAIDNAQNYDYVYVVFFDSAKPKDKDNNQPIAARDDAKIMIDGDTIKDLWGNKLGNFEVKVKVVSDDEKPVVKSVKVTAEDEIQITFSKTVKALKDNKVSFTVKDKDGNNVVKNISVNDDKTVDITLKSAMPNKDVTLKITKVVDTTINENKLDDYEEVVTITDKSAPYVKKIAFSEATTTKLGQLYIFFNEPVDDEATKLENYQIGKKGETKLTTLSGAAEFFQTSNVVLIELTKAENKLVKEIGSANFRLIVNKVKDAAGVEIEQKIKEGYVTFGDISKVRVTAAEATALDTVKVTFNQNIEEINAAAFKQIGGKDVKEITSVEADEVVLKLKDNLALAATGELDGSPEVELKDGGTIIGNLTDGKSDYDTGASALVVDKVALENIKHVDGNKEYAFKVDYENRKITLFFNRHVAPITEALLASALEIKVGDNTLTAAEDEIAYTVIGAAAKEIVIEVKVDVKGEFVIKTVQPNLIKAAGGEKKPVKAFELKRELDLAGPVLKSVDLNEAKDKVTFHFDEVLDETSAKTPGNFVFTKQDGNPGTALSDPALSDDKKSVTYTITAGEVKAGANVVVSKDLSDANKTKSTQDSEMFVVQKDGKKFANNPPKVVGVSHSSDGGNFILVEFSQKIVGTPDAAWVAVGVNTYDDSIALEDENVLKVKVQNPLANTHTITINMAQVYNASDVPVVKTTWEYDGAKWEVQP